jgi:hypothetical protein
MLSEAIRRVWVGKRLTVGFWLFKRSTPHDRARISTDSRAELRADDRQTENYPPMRRARIDASRHHQSKYFAGVETDVEYPRYTRDCDALSPPKQEGHGYLLQWLRAPSC